MRNTLYLGIFCALLSVLTACNTASSTEDAGQKVETEGPKVELQYLNAAPDAKRAGRQEVHYNLLNRGDKNLVRIRGEVRFLDAAGAEIQGGGFAEAPETYPFSQSARPHLVKAGYQTKNTLSIGRIPTGTEAYTFVLLEAEFEDGSTFAPTR